MQDERPDPTEIRWTPRQHYDAAVEIIADGEPWQNALVHTMLGVLSALIGGLEAVARHGGQP